MLKYLLKEKLMISPVSAGAGYIAKSSAVSQPKQEQTQTSQSKLEKIAEQINSGEYKLDLKALAGRIADELA